MARIVRRYRVNTVLDPAVGTGNLLSAVAQLSKGSGLQFCGLDVSKKALVEARTRSISEQWPATTLLRRNFLRSRKPRLASKKIAIVMNPPYRGYADLDVHSRKAAARLGLGGRVDLAYLFCAVALRAYRPVVLVALVPSTWRRSRTSQFRQVLANLGYAVSWRKLGNRVFGSVETNVGILVATRTTESTKAKRTSRKRPANSLVVRHGVATGGDRLFAELAKLGRGRLVEAVSARDIARRRPRPRRMWIPKKPPRPAIRGRLRSALERRTCVSSRQRQYWETHDAPSSWFFGKPKILVPELFSELRFELDATGELFPLHSVLAVRSPSVASARRLLDYLRRPEIVRLIQRRTAVLGGGARRISVHTLRSIPLSAALSRDFAVASSSDSKDSIID